VDLTIELTILTETSKYNKNGLKWFWKYPIQTYYDLEGLIELGASQVLVDAPLFFDLEKVNSCGIKVRVIPNQCYQSYIPRANGITGCWILPQHMYLYEKLIYMIEFTYINNIQLNRLIEVYKNDKKWIEDCAVLFKYFDTHIMGGAIPEDIAQARLNCKQKCATNGRCRLCERSIELAQTITEKGMKK